MIDTSHANSGKKPENQPLVMADIARQIRDGEPRIVGVMTESNLVAGRQDVLPGTALTYGQSITDGCIDWQTTVPALNLLADAVAQYHCLRPGRGRFGLPTSRFKRREAYHDTSTLLCMGLFSRFCAWDAGCTAEQALCRLSTRDRQCFAIATDRFNSSPSCFSSRGRCS